MTGDDRQQLTSLLVFGDLRQQANRLLQPPPTPDPRPGPPQIFQLTIALRRIVHVMSRYLDNPMFSVGVMKGTPDAWTEGLAGCLDALRFASSKLNCRRCFKDFPEFSGHHLDQLEPGSLPSRLDAAATAITAGRDILQTHFTTTKDGLPEECSDWAPVIISAPVSRALLAGLADQARAAGVLFWPLRIDAGDDRRARTVWNHIGPAARALQALAYEVERAQDQVPVRKADVRLLDAIPLNIPPEPRTPSGIEQVTALSAGTIVTAQRISHALRGSAARARWTPDLTAESMRQTAACCVVTNLNFEIITQSLARQAAHLGYQDLIPYLGNAAANAGDARRAWLAAARAWDQMTTDSRGELSPVAAEAGNLALWTGRLAYADPQWTPARGTAHEPRPPDILAADPADFSSVITAMHYAADSVSRIAMSGQGEVLAAAGAGRLHMPAQPERLYARRPARPFVIATGSQIESAFAAYAQAATASRGTLQATEHLAEKVGAPSQVLVTAARHADYAQRLGSVGQVQQIVLDLGERDPALLERAARADRETHNVLAAARASRSARYLARPAGPRSPYARDADAAELRGLEASAGRFLESLESGAAVPQRRRTADPERHRTAGPQDLEIEP